MERNFIEVDIYQNGSDEPLPAKLEVVPVPNDESIIFRIGNCDLFFPAHEAERFLFILKTAITHTKRPNGPVGRSRTTKESIADLGAEVGYDPNVPF